MKKYIMLVIMFIISICFVCYEDNSNVVESVSNVDSIYVFNDMSNTSLINNPDTSDINVEWWGTLMIYSIIMVSFIIYDKKNIKKYEYVK